MCSFPPLHSSRNCATHRVSRYWTRATTKLGFQITILPSQRGEHRDTERFFRNPQVTRWVYGTTSLPLTNPPTSLTHVSAISPAPMNSISLSRRPLLWFSPFLICLLLYYYSTFLFVSVWDFLHVRVFSVCPFFDVFSFSSAVECLGFDFLMNFHFGALMYYYYFCVFTLRFRRMHAGDFAGIKRNFSFYFLIHPLVFW